MQTLSNTGNNLKKSVFEIWIKRKNDFQIQKQTKTLVFIQIKKKTSVINWLQTLSNTGNHYNKFSFWNENLKEKLLSDTEKDENFSIHSNKVRHLRSLTVER